MTCNIYALLVGIDNYPHPVSSLKGCVNDVTDVEEYLRGRINHERFHLHLLTLKNQEATRQAIIDGFRQHLCLASSNDVALFYYSGYGSQELAPHEFWHLESDRLNETLVCWDSRTEGSWDLADKELAKLIAEVAAKAPRITIIMDCCHSGSGTKSPLQKTAVRCLPTEKRQRPLNSYICSLQEVEKLAVVSRRPGEKSTGWVLANGCILLAACQNNEDAKEYYGNGQIRGAFCFFLMETLKRVNGSLTYRDLFQRVNALVCCKVTGQSPHLEATHPGDLDQPFLGGAIAERSPYFTVSYHKDYGWVIDGGAIHAIPYRTNNDETTLLALFPFDSTLKQLQNLADAVGEAEVIEVLPQLSKVSIRGLEIGKDSSQSPVFKAVVTSLPMPPLGIWLEGDEEGILKIRQALLEVEPEKKPSLYLTEVTEQELVEFRVLARNGHYLVVRPADDRPLVAPLNYTSESASQVVKRLEHIARWMNVAELSSPATSRIRPDAVQIQIYQNNQAIKDPQIRLNYKPRGHGRWRQPSFYCKLTNTSSETLYCALLDLTERYTVDADLFATGGVWLSPGEEAWAAGKKPFYANVPQELWEQGITEFKDIFKLIVSTAEFDATLLDQQNLDLNQTRAIEAGRDATCRVSTLNRLMKRIQTRDIGDIPLQEELYDDWVTSQVTMTTIRPLNATLVPREGEGVSLGVGVMLKPHPGLQAKARLTTVAQSSVDLGNCIWPAILREDPLVTQPFQFTTSWGTAPSLLALELSVSDLEANTIQTVTPHEPLKLLVDMLLEEGEQLLPVGYDGEFFLPLGSGESHDGKTEIRLERLPEPVLEGKSSVCGYIRIFFQKVVGAKHLCQNLSGNPNNLYTNASPLQKLALECEYPILAAADVSQDETVELEGELEKVKQLASSARILLCIPGIIGDTQSMVKSIQRAKIEVEAQQRSLLDLYDLVLTFDYEHLNTSIEKNGRLLKQRLEAVGLGANHGKVLHVVAHSIGGLVCRWFIEREGGNQIVQHLIMLGTPNIGSPWPTVQECATTALGIGLNNLSAIAWPVSLLGSLVSASSPTGIATSASTIETIDVSLDQMQAGSPQLQSSSANPNPGIPYTIIAGNTSILPRAMQLSPEQQSSPIERLMHKLFNPVVALPFFSEPNDIVASVHSIKSDRSFASLQPKIQELICDHLVYFINKAMLDALSKALTQDPVRELKSFSELISITQEQGSSINAHSVGQAQGLDPTMADAPLADRDRNWAPIPIPQPELDQVNQTLEKPRLNGVVVGVIGLLLAVTAILGVMKWQRSQQQEPQKQDSNSSALPCELKIVPSLMDKC